MVHNRNFFWKKVPFLKVLLATISGIVVQWHWQCVVDTWLWAGGIAFICFSCLFFMDLFKRYRFSFLGGVLTIPIFISVGAMLAWKKDIRNHPNWFGKHYSANDGIVAVLEEPLVEKTRSLKANARVDFVLTANSAVPVKGHIIIYFSKDLSHNLAYGSQVVFRKPLQEIRNAGNPGGFNYKRYALFQGITHQVFLQQNDFEILPAQKTNPVRQFIFNSRDKLLTILRTNIKGEKELGLAEALLIGYKQDLDQSLVQSYTNTGVVHIIAISGLHLGLIYWLLGLLLRPLQKSSRLRWLRAILIITSLWTFSLLAGAQPSILRSALVFTCIVTGESLSRKSSIYNTIAVSAFILLCINPYWLWDVGFQLSYSAVLSIIIFMRPIYNWFYIRNKLLDATWKLNAVTLAAQVLTIPVSIYHFDQFPNAFILTNLLAVPLSSIILLGEILLCSISFVPAIAAILGDCLNWLIHLMNTYIERVASLPYSLWQGLQISLTQTFLLLIFIAGTSYWLMERSKWHVYGALIALLAFCSLRSFSFIQANRQEKMIIYNVPKKKAIDLIYARDYLFIGDNSLLTDDFSRNFHLAPARILNRVSVVKPTSTVYKNYWEYAGRHILLIDQPVSFRPVNKKPIIDLLVLSGNPKIYLRSLAAVLEIRQVVFDGSVPAWKSNYWKKDCDALKIPWHDVSLHGAFVMSFR